MTVFVCPCISPRDASLLRSSRAASDIRAPALLRTASASRDCFRLPVHKPSRRFAASQLPRRFRHERSCAASHRFALMSVAVAREQSRDAQARPVTVHGDWAYVTVHGDWAYALSF